MAKRQRESTSVEAKIADLQNFQSYNGKITFTFSCNSSDPKVVRAEFLKQLGEEFSRASVTFKAEWEHEDPAAQ